MGVRLLTALLLLSLTDGLLAQERGSKSGNCGGLDPILSQFSTIAPPAVTSFCSSYLHLPTYPSTTTKTVVTTIHRTSTTTSTRVKKTTTTRPTLTLTEVSVIEASTTVYSTYGVIAKRAARPTPEPFPVGPSDTITGLPESVSKACSCLLPPKTVTVTETSRTRTTDTVTAFTTSTSTIIKQPLTTKTRTTTVSYTFTECVGTNPSPSFKLQIRDVYPTSTDQYNNLYPTVAPYPPDSGYEGDNIELVPDIAGAGVFYFDCINRLTVTNENGIPVYLAIASNAGGDSAFVYAFNQTEFVHYESSRYLNCRVKGNFLACRVRVADDEDPFLTQLATSEQVALIGTVIAILSPSNEFGPDFYYPFRFQVYYQ